MPAKPRFDLAIGIAFLIALQPLGGCAKKADEAQSASAASEPAPAASCRWWEKLLGNCKDAPPAPPPPQVGVVTLVAQALPMLTELPGRTAPYMIAEVRPQVGGIIQKRLFEEGGNVEAGQTLYQIDPALFQATLDNAKATLAKAQANLEVTRLKTARYKELVAIHAVSTQDYDNMVASVKQGEAEVASAKAAVETARINLDYTKVTSPIPGRIGKSSVTPGALVTASQAQALATVQQLDPIYVDVTQSVTETMRLRRDLANGVLQSAGSNGAKVALMLEDGSEYPLAGVLQFSDVTVDQGTGAITLRAVFPNPKNELLPGMYVRAILSEGINKRAILVPQQGVTRNNRGEPTALVLNNEGTVEMRELQTSRTIGDKWLVSAGLAPGERVIVEGVQLVRPGAHAIAAPPKPETTESMAGMGIMSGMAGISVHSNKKPTLDIPKVLLEEGGFDDVAPQSGQPRSMQAGESAAQPAKTE